MVSLTTVVFIKLVMFAISWTMVFKIMIFIGCCMNYDETTVVKSSKENPCTVYSLYVPQSWSQCCSAQYTGPPCKKKPKNISAELLFTHILAWCICLRTWRLTCDPSVSGSEPWPLLPLLTWEHSDGKVVPQTLQPGVKWKV